jgi:hypothetical protein
MAEDLVRQGNNGLIDLDSAPEPAKGLSIQNPVSHRFSFAIACATLRTKQVCKDDRDMSEQMDELNTLALLKTTGLSNLFSTRSSATSA